LFVSIYLATFVASGYFLRQYAQLCAFVAVAVATSLTILVWAHRRFAIGFLVPPRFPIVDFALGALFAPCLILTCDGLIVLFSKLRESWIGGFPGAELLAVFIPAALHEELAFRGYVYQKLRQWNRAAAILKQLYPSYHIAAIQITLPWNRTFETGIEVGLAPNL